MNKLTLIFFIFFIKLRFYVKIIFIILLGARRVYSFGFGYGATWGAIILLFASVVLLICDRESEEIFYKEKQIEEEEEEEAGEA